VTASQQRARILKTLSLRQRLYALTLVSLAPALFLLVYNVTVIREQRRVEVHNEAMRLGEQSSLELQRVIGGAEAVLLSLARAPSIRSFDTRQCVPYLRDIVAAMPQFDSLGVVDSSGTLRCRQEMPAQAVNAKERPYFKEVMAHGTFYIGTFQKGLVNGAAQLPLAYPIRDEAGHVNGMIVAALDIQWLNGLVNDRAFNPEEALTVADRNGVIVARHPLAEQFIGTKIPEQYMSLVHAKTPGTIEVLSQDGTQRILGYIPPTPISGLYVSAGIGAKAAMEPVNTATLRAALAIVAGAALAFLFAALTGHSLISEPVARVLRTVDSWRGGDSSARTGMINGSEISLIGAAMDRFMQELEETRAGRQEAEAERVLLSRELEHRVKNTLATVRAIAAQTFTGESMKPALGVFSGRLVALGRAYEQLRKQDWQSADLEGTVASTMLPFPSEQFDISGPPIAVNPKATLALTMALHELATNAAKYGALSLREGRIAIAWHVADDKFHLEWREYGGPPVAAPSRKGFGTRMIKQILASDLGGEVWLTYPASGAVCRIEVRLAKLTEHKTAQKDARQD
jgi:two-component sensor histidine kinase